MHSEIAILFLTGLCFGQINLANFNSSDVRRGCSVSTNVDSLLLETRVNSGTAVTLITCSDRISILPTRMVSMVKTLTA